MTPEQIAEAAKLFPSYLRKIGHAGEQPDGYQSEEHKRSFFVIDGEQLEPLDSYDVVYRSLAILISPSKFQEEVLKGYMPTFEESRQILEQAYPYFVKLFKNQRELENAKYLHESHSDVWR